MQIILLVVAMVAGLSGLLAVPANSTVLLGDGVVDIPAGQIASLPVRVQDISGLYGYELHLSFDPAVVEVVDADAQKPGVQARLGDFLAPDFVAQNIADNQTGKIDFAMTQINPHEARAGSGTLFTIDLRGRAAGQTTQVQVTAGLFADRDGLQIPVSLAAGTVRVVAAGPQQPSVTPSQAPTALRPSETPQPTGEPDQASAPASTGAAGAPALTPTSTPPLNPIQPTAAVGAADETSPTDTSIPSAQPSQTVVIAEAPAESATRLPHSTAVGAPASTSAATPDITAASLTATSTPVLLARVPVGAAGKPILSGNPSSASTVAAAHTSPTPTNQSWMLAAAGAALGGAVLGLIAFLIYMRRGRQT